MTSVHISELPRPVPEADLNALAKLLSETVGSGGAVSFLAPLSHDDAREWWRRTIEGSSARAIFLVAQTTEGIVGTVQVQPAWAPNQPHRAEICKLLVASTSRGSGIGERLMREAETRASAAGITLLTLDATRGGAAERLYRRLGWTHVGTIPDFALNPDAAGFHDAVVFYKRVGAAGEGGEGNTAAAQRDTRADASMRRTYNMVTDTVFGPNLRLWDNLLQTTAILAFAVIGAIGGMIVSSERFLGALVGLVVGIVAGTFLSGLYLGIYRAVQHARGRHD